MRSDFFPVTTILVAAAAANVEVSVPARVSVVWWLCVCGVSLTRKMTTSMLIQEMTRSDILMTFLMITLQCHQTGILLDNELSLSFYWSSF